MVVSTVNYAEGEIEHDGSLQLSSDFHIQSVIARWYLNQNCINTIKIKVANMATQKGISDRQWILLPATMVIVLPIMMILLCYCSAQTARILLLLL